MEKVRRCELGIGCPEILCRCSLGFPGVFESAPQTPHTLHTSGCLIGAQCQERDDCPLFPSKLPNVKQRKPRYLTVRVNKDRLFADYSPTTLRRTTSHREKPRDPRVFRSRIGSQSYRYMQDRSSHLPRPSPIHLAHTPPSCCWHFPSFFVAVLPEPSDRSFLTAWRSSRRFASRCCIRFVPAFRKT